MNHDDGRQSVVRNIGAALALLALAFGVALSSGAPAGLAFTFGLAASGGLLFVVWGIPSLIDVLAYWRQFTAGRIDEVPMLPPAPPPVPVMREIAVHGRGGDGVLRMVEFPDPHEQAWREALARFLMAAKAEGSLTAEALARYVDHREHWVRLTNVLRDAGLVDKAPGVRARLAPGITFHAAIKRVTVLTSPLPLPASAPPIVRTAPTTARSETVTTGQERSEQYA